jgi:hypothetical protein
VPIDLPRKAVRDPLQIAVPDTQRDHSRLQECDLTLSQALFQVLLRPQSNSPFEKGLGEPWRNATLIR